MVEAVNNINALSTGYATKAVTKRDVLSAIKTASDRTGVDFTYLVNKASQESSFNPVAKASGSSATGLYQFIDQTWLKTVKANGAEYGLGDMADKITIGSDGMARVASEADRKAILDLRKDPTVSAEMAAELAKDNKEALQKSVSGKIGATEMYLAHFLGSGGAAELLNQMKVDPSAKAAEILPSAAAANKSVFYNRDTGEARSVGEIYQTFAKKFDKTPDLGNMDVQEASASPSGGSKTTTRGIMPGQKPAKTRLASFDEDAFATDMAISSIMGAKTDNVALANGVSLTKATNAPFATMVLAQMDMETFGLDAKDYVAKMGAGDQEHRKSIMNALASAG